MCMHGGLILGGGGLKFEGLRYTMQLIDEATALNKICKILSD